MPLQSNVDTLDGLGESHVVELSVLAPHGQDQVQEDMKNFAEQLKPYPSVRVLFIASMSTIDHCD